MKNADIKAKSGGELTVAEINSVAAGSTGGIMRGIAQSAREQGVGVITACPSSRTNSGLCDMYIGSRFSRNLHIRLAELTGRHGFYSRAATASFVKKLEKIHPDAVHLHNLHGDYINLKTLFEYLAESKVPVVWTLHDCWAFTGRCPHFEFDGCGKWQTGCGGCPMPPGDYPRSRRDVTAGNLSEKRRLFTMPENMTVVAPSQWLADLAAQSFLKKYPVRVIRNGIDLSVFRPTPDDFREKHGIAPDEKVMLGAASGWGERKGLDVFAELSKRFGDECRVVLVGTDEAAERRLPENVISVRRTEDRRRLAGIYTAADVFVNPTREDTFPTVNIEALACGTPVITFDTGGSPECVGEDGTCGSVVPKNDIGALEAEIRRVFAEHPYSRGDCVARGALFDREARFGEYVTLYGELAGRDVAKKRTAEQDT